VAAAGRKENWMKSPSINDPAAGAGGAAEGDNPQGAHFRTDHLPTNLGGRAISGRLVTAGAQAAKFGESSKKGRHVARFKK